MIMTVNGERDDTSHSPMLTHEHVLVDFAGAELVGPHRYDFEAAFATILPHLERAKEKGMEFMVECTPAYLGRDVRLLRRLSEASGVGILTNTGYYGARDGFFLPAHAFRESAEQLASRWVGEWKEGIEGTGIRPGFIKIAVNGARPLSGMDQKLVRAAAQAHRETGLTIVSHTKDGPVFEELEILRSEGVGAEAFIWAHAQDEPDSRRHVAAAELGAWVAFDGLGADPLAYLKLLAPLKERQLLHRVLLSHDAGWVEPGNPGRRFRGYCELFDLFLPTLRDHSFSPAEIDQLIVKNPATAFAVGRKGLGGS